LSKLQLEIKLNKNKDEFKHMLFPHFVDMILDEKDVGSPSIGLYLDGLMFAGFHEIVPEFQRDTLVKNLTLI